MVVIAYGRLRAYMREHPPAANGLSRWYQLTTEADWSSPQALKEQFANASIINSERVVFNIHGNDYRLIVAIVFPVRTVYVKWFGTHAEYDKIDAATV